MLGTCASPNAPHHTTQQPPPLVNTLGIPPATFSLTLLPCHVIVKPPEPMLSYTQCISAGCIDDHCSAHGTLRPRSERIKRYLFRKCWTTQWPSTNSLHWYPQPPAFRGRYPSLEHGRWFSKGMSCSTLSFITLIPFHCRTTGVSAMQLAVVGPTKAIIFDKVWASDDRISSLLTESCQVEHNPLKRPNGKLAWAVELVEANDHDPPYLTSGLRWDFVSNTARPLNPITNTFCAAGAHLSNGTFVNTGTRSISHLLMSDLTLRARW
jgi:hypothetical protein